MEKAELYIVAALAAVGLYVYLDMKKGAKTFVNAASNAASNAGASIGLSLAAATVPSSQKYLGYPSKYDAKTGTWYVHVDGLWIVDQYQTQLGKEQLAKMGRTK